MVFPSFSKTFNPDSKEYIELLSYVKSNKESESKREHNKNEFYIPTLRIFNHFKGNNEPVLIYLYDKQKIFKTEEIDNVFAFKYPSFEVKKESRENARTDTQLVFFFRELELGNEYIENRKYNRSNIKLQVKEPIVFLDNKEYIEFSIKLNSIKYEILSNIPVNVFKENLSLFRNIDYLFRFPYLKGVLDDMLSFKIKKQSIKFIISDEFCNILEDGNKVFDPFKVKKVHPFKRAFKHINKTIYPKTRLPIIGKPLKNIL